jgi:hypothetical protein
MPRNNKFTFCVDPGINVCGVAVFDGDELIKACLVVNPCKVRYADPLVRVRAMASAVWGAFNGPDAIILERPQLGTYGPARQKDLVLLCEVNACILGMMGVPDVQSVTPHEWKKSLDGDVMTERIKERLTDQDWTRVEDPGKSVEHNMFDAIGIGLWKFGRLNRKRVIAR